MDFMELSTFPSRPLEFQAGFGKEMGRHCLLLRTRIRAQLCSEPDINKGPDWETGSELD